MSQRSRRGRRGKAEPFAILSLLWSWGTGRLRSRRRASLNLETLEDRSVPTLLGQQLFPADNPWNQPITNAPVAARSDAIMNNLLSLYGDERIHPDFGQNFLFINKQTWTIEPGVGFVIHF